MSPVTEKLRSFLQFVAIQLIEKPQEAQLKVAELPGGKIRFKLVLPQSDVAVMIGKNGFTVAAIRNVMRMIADQERIHVSLLIHSHEEEEAVLARGDAG